MCVRRCSAIAVASASRMRFTTSCIAQREHATSNLALPSSTRLTLLAPRIRKLGHDRCAPGLHVAKNVAVAEALDCARRTACPGAGWPVALSPSLSPKVSPCRRHFSAVSTSQHRVLPGEHAEARCLLSPLRLPVPPPRRPPERSRFVRRPPARGRLAHPRGNPSSWRSRIGFDGDDAEV